MEEVVATAPRLIQRAFSSVRTETIESLTELEDLERVYAQLCSEEVR